MIHILMEPIIFSEIDFASDVKDFISNSSDVTYENEQIKKTILESDNLELLEVTKKIGSPIEIIEVKKISEKLIEENL